MLAGAERGNGGCPPSNQASSEVAAVVNSSAPAKKVPAGVQVMALSPPVNAPSPELRFPVIFFPPAGECWPELSSRSEAVLRRAMLPRR